MCIAMDATSSTEPSKDFSIKTRFACGYFTMALAMPATLQITADGRIRLTLDSGKVMVDAPAALAECTDSGPYVLRYQWIRIGVGSRTYKLQMHNWGDLGTPTVGAARDQIKECMERIRQAATVPPDMSKPVIAAQLTPAMRHGARMSYIMPVLTLGVVPLTFACVAVLSRIPEASRTGFITTLGMFVLPIAYVVVLNMFLTRSNDRDLRLQAAADNSTQPEDILPASTLRP
jgi:hypothetical protein